MKCFLRKKRLGCNNIQKYFENGYKNILPLEKIILKCLISLNMYIIKNILLLSIWKLKIEERTQKVH